MRRYSFVLVGLSLVFLGVLGWRVEGITAPPEVFIYPGVRVGQVRLGGLTETQARSLLEEVLYKRAQRKVVFSLDELTASLPQGGVRAEEMDWLLAQASAIGRRGPWYHKLQERLRARLGLISLRPGYGLVLSEVKQQLEQAFVAHLTPKRDAQLQISFEQKEPRLDILSEQDGRGVDLDLLRKRLEEQAVSAKPEEPILVSTLSLFPRIKAEEIAQFIPQVKTLLTRPESQVKHEEQFWKVDSKLLASWIKFEPVESTRVPGGAVTLTLDRLAIEQWLAGLAKTIERPAVDPVFELNDEGNRVLRFSPGQAGVQFLREENAEQLRLQLLQGASTFKLRVKEISVRKEWPAQARQRGIQELVGTAFTDFKGSPPNRVKNIARGAALLSGTLIAPGEEFSLLEHLRPFTIENGYLPELVIKAAEGKTQPEIGGGLCQLGTTMFRTVLNSGLPITARQNHSYRVSYYEPPVGMDATIYDPAPDFKFLNDTGHGLLLIAKIEKTFLTFELWGTRDGRQAKISAPVISNIQKPPPKKEIPTTDLPPGKIKCTEKAHLGSDARFTYTVAYADGKILEKEFRSRYRPWQEVCLVGVAPEEFQPTPEEAPMQPPRLKLAETLPSAEVVGVVGEE